MVEKRGRWLHTSDVVPTLALLLLDIGPEEVVQEFTDDGDRAEASDRLPARSDRGLDDVGPKLQVSAATSQRA